MFQNDFKGSLRGFKGGGSPKIELIEKTTTRDSKGFWRGFKSRESGGTKIYLTGYFCNWFFSCSS